MRPVTLRRGIAVSALLLALAALAAAPARAQQPARKFENLKVLPKNIPENELGDLMNSFTRALGVRCTYCHVAPEGHGPRPEDYPKDDKPAKLKARAMIQMVRDINDKYLAKLEKRADPPVKVQCVTCHHGTTEPRTLQDVLRRTYDTGGVDSMFAKYNALRGRYYGMATYDFGETPLFDVARRLGDSGRMADAVRIQALNAEMNPKSMFARRRYAIASTRLAFATSGEDSGSATYRRFKNLYGPQVITEDVLNEVGYELLFANNIDPGVLAFRLNTQEYPKSGNAFDSLGEALVKSGAKQQAIEAYQKAIELDPANDNARHQLDVLNGKAGAGVK